MPLAQSKNSLFLHKPPGSQKKEPCPLNYCLTNFTQKSTSFLTAFQLLICPSAYDVKNNAPPKITYQYVFFLSLFLILATYLSSSFRPTQTSGTMEPVSAGITLWFSAGCKAHNSLPLAKGSAAIQPRSPSFQPAFALNEGLLEASLKTGNCVEKD